MHKLIYYMYMQTPFLIMFTHNLDIHKYIYIECRFGVMEHVNPCWP